MALVGFHFIGAAYEKSTRPGLDQHSKHEIGSGLPHLCVPGPVPDLFTVVLPPTAVTVVMYRAVRFRSRGWPEVWSFSAP